MNDGAHDTPQTIPTAPYATAAGTTRYRARFGHLAAEHFRLRYGLWLSSIGLGTYLTPGSGPRNGVNRSSPIELLETSTTSVESAPDAKHEVAKPMGAHSSEGYEAALAAALSQGCNVVDSAGNYRDGRSEREVGAALAALFRQGDVRRDEVVVCTKGGFLVGPDAAAEATRLVASKVTAADEIVAGGHCIAPGYLRTQIARSLDNLQLQTVDVYYLHNPEVQLQTVGPQEFKARIRRAFEQLEREAEAGRIRLYGVATWDGLLTDPQDRTYLPLTLLEQTAQEVGGEKHRFRFVQFPYNVLTRTAFTGRNQPMPGRTQPSGEPVFGPLLGAAMQLGLAAVTSATLAQGQVLARLPAQFARALGEWDTRAQAAIHFNRSTPGVTTALVGMGSRVHVDENLAVAARDPLTREQFFRLFQRP